MRKKTATKKKREEEEEEEEEANIEMEKKVKEIKTNQRRKRMMMMMISPKRQTIRFQSSRVFCFFFLLSLSLSRLLSRSPARFSLFHSNSSIIPANVVEVKSLGDLEYHWIFLRRHAVRSM
ncbi:MAG: hypothetical protein JNN26_26805 [Candidatus Obscuribacter sp.]|nr:hypothetical protein [Candidatus Obscuribacter sp.]